MSELKVGMIGLDTSHVSAFVKLLNDPTNEFHVPGVRIVKAFPGGSAKFSSSINRVEGFTNELREKGVEIVDSIEALAGLDAYFLESVDGDQHLEQCGTGSRKERSDYELLKHPLCSGDQ